MKIFFSLVLVLFSLTAFAHPLGVKAFGHKTELNIFPSRIECEYVLEVPTEILALKISNYVKDNNVSYFNEAESRKFNQTILDSLKQGLEIYINDVKYPLSIDPSFKDETGKGDLNFFEYRLKLFTDIGGPASNNVSIKFINRNVEERDSVFLSGVILNSGIILESTNIPEKMFWSSDQSFRQINLTYKLDPSSSSIKKIGGFAITKKENESLTKFLYQKEVTLTFLLVAIGTAFLLGAGHALSPGHGKTLVGAYLVGSQGKYLHAVFLGIIVTVTHTAAVFILGFVYLFFSKYLIAEKYLPLIGIVSGISIATIGVYLWIKRYREYKHGHHHHDHPHNHDTSLKSLLGIGIGGGMVPCPTALALMLVAISINKIGFGLLLVAAFSLGLAVVLSVLGIIALSAASIFNRYDDNKVYWRIVPLISATIVILIGASIIISSWKVTSF